MRKYFSISICVLPRLLQLHNKIFHDDGPLGVQLDDFPNLHAHVAKAVVRAPTLPLDFWEAC